MKRFGVAAVVLLAALGAGCALRSASQGTPLEPAQVESIDLDAVRAYEAGEFPRSIGLYRTLLAKDPANHRYMNNLGVLLLKEGKAGEALDAFESASLLAPQNADYVVNMGFAQIKLDNQEKAIDFFDRALQLAPRNARALYGKGVAYLFLNENEIALGFFQQASALDPSALDALFMGAYAAQKSNLWSDAEQGFTRFIDQTSDTTQKANALSNRALCRFHQGNQAGGMADINAAIQLDATNAVYYYNRAYGSQSQQKYEEAVQDYTRALAHQISFPEAYINRGELNYLLGNEDKGCADLQRACDLGFCEAIERYKAANKCPD
ncbi:MAG: tetratricopeptide repeat protein [Desulfovibrionaceae bacterium]